MLFDQADAGIQASGLLLTLAQNHWRRSGMLQIEGSADALAPALLESVQTAPAEWRDLMIGGKRFRANLNY